MTEQIAKGEIVIADDFAQYRIVGYVPHAAQRGMNPNLNVPLISHVVGGLWQGGCVDGVQLPSDFDFVLSLYPWEHYDLGPNTKRKEVMMYDALDQGFDQVDDLAHRVKTRLDLGLTCLVHCQAGLNRSGLVSARILTLMGYEPAAAIGLLRSQRSHLVLCNDAFENWIMDCAASAQ